MLGGQSQDEGIFVYPSHQLDQFHLDTMILVLTFLILLSHEGSSMKYSPWMVSKTKQNHKYSLT